ncbi:MAG: OmpA family protein [Caulobacterales bacterium]|nr:OmpA family protein [Caulobacterales bacterium]
MKTAMAVTALAVVGLAGCSSLGFGNRSDLVVDPTYCRHTTVPIYFEEGQAGLSGPARTLIRDGAAALRGCAIDRVQLVGLASATGDAQANLRLSQRRAETVARALAEAGLRAPDVELEAEGEAGARAAGISDPVRRRVEVIIEARPAG